MSKTIHRAKHDDEHTYVIISTDIFKANLSMKAAGVLCYLLSNKDGWQVHAAEVKNHFKDGIASVTTAFWELERNGFLKKVEGKRGGRFNTYYEVYELPPAKIKTVAATKSAFAPPAKTEC